MNLTHFTPTATWRSALVSPLLAVLAAAATLAAAVLPATAQAAEKGSGKSATESRSVAEFQAVATSGNIDLIVRQGAQAVQVQADDNLLPLLETEVANGMLQVRWKRGSSVSTRSKAVVSVTLPKLHTLASAGAADIELQRYTTPALKLTLSGSGDARLDALQADELNVSISGSSDIAGSGKAVVNAQKSLDVSIAGSGDVRYTGNAALKSSVAGSGSIRKL